MVKSSKNTELAPEASAADLPQAQQPTWKERLLPWASGLRLIVVILVVAVIASTTTAVIFYVRSPKDSTVILRDDTTAQVIDKIGQLVVLPTGETPLIATIKDPALLASQPFFAHAQKGDILLIYNKASRAYLYDPIANKIIDVAPLNPSLSPAVH